MLSDLMRAYEYVDVLNKIFENECVGAQSNLRHNERHLIHASRMWMTVILLVVNEPSAYNQK